jgi:cellulose synthase/poly-beta-1,6-N-acetylglucosamine synthase-like glycosyltransferase
MKELAILLSKILFSWLFLQILLASIFLSYLKSPQKDLLPDKLLPKTAVILCLRGTDPFLSQSLQALLTQNYPQYDLKLIIDNQEDPAWKIVIDTIQRQGATNVQIRFLRIVRNSCSLKSSSLVQAVSDLDESYKVVALVDADTIVHPNWLRELVSPLNHPKVGVTTGNRWYLPTGNYWGTLVRYLWNISAVVQMSVYRIPWGGNLAIKTDVIHQTGLLEKWGRAYSEDMMITRILAKHEMQVKFVPSAMVLNQEECDLPRLKNWLQRQLLSSRLYHPHWWTVVADGILTIVLPYKVLVFCLVALLTKQWTVAVVCFSSFFSYMMALLLLAIALEKAVQQVISHHQAIPKLSLFTVLKILIATPLTQWIYGLVMVSSLWISTVTWRGITYRVKSPWNIWLVQYRPYYLSDQPRDSKISL